MEDNDILNYPACRFNEGVACDPKNQTCSKCGWNPEVAKVRLDCICKTMGIEVPEKTTEGS